MASDVPPSSQSGSQNYPMIFQDANGSPIQIYVDPVGIQNRPNLVRKIRSAGAVISHFPNDARIILVDSTTDTGRQLIRNWGSDQGRNVLEYSWASSSIAAGKPLLEKDEFRDFKTYDDGRPIGGETEVDTGILTPPHTDAGPSSSSVRGRSPTRRSSSQSAPTRRDSFHRPPPQENGSAYNSNPFAMTNGAPSPPPQVQQFPPPSSASPFQSQEFPNFSMSQNNVAQVNPSQMAVLGVNQGSNPIISMTQADLATLVDIVRSQSMSYQPWGGQLPMGIQQSQANMQQFMFNQQHTSNGMVQQPFQNPQFQLMSQNHHFGMNNTLQHQHRDSFTSQVSGDHDPHSPSPSVLPPSLQRIPSLSVHSKEKGKERADPLGASRHRKPSPFEIETPLSSSSSFRSPSPVPKLGSPRKTGQIFTSDSGQSLQFFVQVDLRNRAAIVNKIKKNGGKITGENLKADYIILYSGSDSFPDLIRATAASNKVALNATFVEDCVEEGMLLDVDEYVLEHSAIKRKRGRPGLLEGSDTRKQRVNEQRRERRQEENAAKKKSPKRPRASSNSPSRPDGPRSPLPPPPRLLTEDKYSFTEEERAYVLAFVSRLMQRDHLVSNTGIANKLYKRMPHHSSRSWMMYVSKNVRTEVEEIRKRAGIAHRLAGPTTTVRVQSSESPSKRPRLNEPIDTLNDNAAPPTLNPEDEQEDLDVICNFFASGGGDDEDDERVWANLTHHKRCKTAAEWPEFYRERENLINARIRMLLDAAPGGEGSPQTKAE